ncbi:MAG: 4Fe-4S binding protein [Gemmatimonadota bacterium]|nr:MAG: 4Fe-4S binding protein [Gemmatimonadota bacterium]
MINAYTTNTLTYNSELCTGCKMCSTVCPQAVFAQEKQIARIVNPESCIECGACQRNCPTGAIFVESGVGCAYAMMYAALTGKKEPTCGGEDEPSCCCSSDN